MSNIHKALGSALNTASARCSGPQAGNVDASEGEAGKGRKGGEGGKGRQRRGERRWRRGERAQELQGIQGYIVSWKLAWATRDLVSKKQRWA